MIHRRGPWRSLEAVEYAPLEWIDRFDNRPLLEPIGNIPPAEAEQRWWDDQERTAIAALAQSAGPPTNPARFAAPIGGYDVDNLVRDSLGVADAVGAERFHWVGCSVGGVIGLRMAAEVPSRVQSLFVCGASAEAEPIEKLAAYESLLLDTFAEHPERAIDRLMPILYGAPFLADPQNAAAVARQREIILSCGSARVARAAAPVLRRVDIRHMLPHVACPTLVAVGELDGANGPRKADVIASGIPGARLVVMPGIGHQPNAEAPEAFGEMIADFLESVGARP